MQSYSSARSAAAAGNANAEASATPIGRGGSASSTRNRSRSPSASPGFGRRLTGSPAMPQPLPTIPSASNLTSGGDLTTSSSPRSFTLSQSIRSSSLAPSNSQRTLPDPIGSGSPRETRLWERGNTPTTASNNAFSSSFPSSGGIWGNDATLGTPSAATPPVRSSLSRNLSLSGQKPGSNQGPATGSAKLDWPDSPYSSNNDSQALEIREGRSRSRFGASVGPGLPTMSGAGSGLESALHRSLSIASERAKYDQSGGIAISNMSPFQRDVGQLPEATNMKVPHLPAPNQPYSASFTVNSDFFPQNRGRPAGFGVDASATGTKFMSGFNVSSPGDFNMNLPSSGLGRGQGRSGAFWGNSERPLHEGDEDEESDEDYAPPTRSGATSRRHSVAAFTGSSALRMTSPPARTQIGFHLPSEGHGIGHSRSASLSVRSPTTGFDTFGGSSALDDDDLLATNLSNALQLNLDAQAARERTSPNALSPPGGHAASLPVQMAQHMPTQSAAHSYAPGQHLPSPYRSGSSALYGPSSPPHRGLQDRRSSTSGDPYSPSASAARYLATAHNVQPPPLQPPTGNRPDSQLSNPNMPATLWPPAGANVFSQSSPHFRSGVLPPPETLANYDSDEFTQSSQRRQESPVGMGRDVSPNQMFQGPPSFAPQGRGGPMPPFAGFAGRPHMSGPPPPMLSPMNAHAHPYYVAPIAPQPSLNELGRGIPLHALPSGGPLYIVEFKAGRTDLFYVDDGQVQLSKGDLVVVEADRGKDLGKVLTSCTLDEVRDFQMHQVESALGQLAAGAGGSATIGGVGVLPPGQAPSAATIARMTKEIHPKRIYGRASPADVALLAVKAHDEAKALSVCRTKVAQHQLPMEVTDAEFQFDRRRLTFFYVADRRIDFRNLVKDLFRLYKTRIWLVANGSF